MVVKPPIRAVRATKRVLKPPRTGAKGLTNKPLNRIDPSRTATLRRSFSVVLRRQFARLKGEIVKLVVDEDAFGLGKAVHDPFALHPTLSNVFCPTGIGGGVDPTCSPVGGHSTSVSKEAVLKTLDQRIERHLVDRGIGGKQLHPHELIGVVNDVEKYLKANPEHLKAVQKTCMAEICTDTGERYAASLYSGDKRVSVYLLRWGSGQEAEWHDHGDGLNGAKVAIRILKGPVENDFLRSDGMVVRQKMVEGKNYALPSHYLHRVATGSDKTTWSIHAYSSPTDGLDKMNFYKFDSDKNPVLDAYGQPIKISEWSKRFITQNVAWMDAVVRSAKPIPEDLDPDGGVHEIDPETGTAMPVPGREVVKPKPQPDQKQLPPEQIKKRKKVLLNQSTATGIVSNAGRWAFQTSPQQLQAFKVWLQARIGQYLTSASEQELWRRYADAGFRKGVGRAWDDTNKARKAVADAGISDQSQQPLDFYQGSRDQFLRSAFGQPVAIEKIQLLVGRSFDDLDNITGDMSTRMTRVLADGLVQGKGPREVARDLTDEVDIGSDRALTIARTEIIRAHAEGQLEALDQLGVEEVGVAVEWSTAGDELVCPKCEDLEGVVLSLEEARGLLPRHPNCRCAFIPANVGEDTEGQKDTKSSIIKSIKASIGEGADDWAGAGVSISKQRPESIFGNKWKFPSEAMSLAEPVAPLSNELLEFSGQLRRLKCRQGEQQNGNKYVS